MSSPMLMVGYACPASWTATPLVGGAFGEVRTAAGQERFAVRLDDVDPYRGLYEPVPPQRLSTAEFEEWRRLLGEAWGLLVAAVPDYAHLLPAGLDSLVPKPRVLFRNPSASTGEAFGSAVLGCPTDAASLAATIVHEFQHIVLGGVLHLAPLYDNDPRERIYVPWRDDPRPFAGAVQGVYAFFGVSAFWRALARSGSTTSMVWFEFAYWRRETWRTLESLRGTTASPMPGGGFSTGSPRFWGRGRMSRFRPNWQTWPPLWRPITGPVGGCDTSGRGRRWSPSWRMRGWLVGPGHRSGC